MSRRLILLAVLAATFAGHAAASTTIPWTVVAHGIASGAPSHADVALLATSAASAHRIAVQVPPSAAGTALHVNYRTSVLVGVFGPFGCADGRVRITRIDESGATLGVRLLVKPLPPGVAACMAVFETYRLLVVPRHSLVTVPTSAKVTVART